MQETWVWSLGWEDPLKEEMATHSSILTLEISWAEKAGGLQSKGSQRIGHNWEQLASNIAVTSELCPYLRTFAVSSDCSFLGLYYLLWLWAFHRQSLWLPQLSILHNKASWFPRMSSAKHWVPEYASWEKNIPWSNKSGKCCIHALTPFWEIFNLY